MRQSPLDTRRNVRASARAATRSPAGLPRTRWGPGAALALGVAGLTAAAGLAGAGAPGPAPTRWWPLATSDPAAVLLAALRYGADAVVLRLWLGLLVSAASWCPGPAGRAARRLAPLLVPTAVRGLARAGLVASVGLAAAPVPGTAARTATAAPAAAASPAGVVPAAPVGATAAPGDPAVTPGGPSLAWATPAPYQAPTVAPPVLAPASGAPASGAPASGAPASGAPAPSGPPALAWGAAGSAPAGRQSPAQGHPRGPDLGRTVTVRPGDTLWGLTSVALGGAPPALTAACWPLLWRVNAAVVGPDPDLIRPGQVLALPAALTRPVPTSPTPTPAHRGGAPCPS